MNDLKPCPFCGSQAGLDDCPSSDGRLFWAECRSADCGVGGRIFASPEEAIAFWDCRAAGVNPSDSASNKNVTGDQK